MCVCVCGALFVCVYLSVCACEIASLSSARYAKFMPSVLICLSGRAESNSGPRQSANHPQIIIIIFLKFL